MSRDSEYAIVEGLWQSLDDQQLIKDVVMKGKYISNSIKFIANRNQRPIDETKHEFFVEASSFVNSLIQNKQLHRAIHVLNNIQIDERYYLFDFYRVSFLFLFLFPVNKHENSYQNEDDAATKELIMERLKHLDSNFEDKEKVLTANHIFFKLLVSNFGRHAKCLESVNRSKGINAVNAENINKIIFGTFMKQPQAWKNVSFF